MALPASSAAQTRFTWPDTSVDVTKYTAVELCLAAARRVQHGQEALNDRTVRRDTAESDEQEPLKPLAAPVRETAVRCAAQFNPQTTKLTDFAYVMELLLLADRDADAKALLQRRLAAAPAKSGRERVSVEDSAVDIYLKVKPVRLQPAEDLLVARARGSADRVDRMSLYYRLMDLSAQSGDTARARRAAGWILAMGDSLTAADRETDKFVKMGGNGGDLVLFAAVQQVVGIRTLVDSLRHSTMAMVNVERTMLAKFMKERVEALPFPIGEHAPRLAGDFWFPSSAAGEQHPAPGRVAIVQFSEASSVTGGCLNVDAIWRTITDACPAGFALLRRLGERFPGLDIDLVMGTRGTFLKSQPPSPAEEAQLDANWIAPYAIKGVVLSVTTRPFWNLPAPDSRRIDKPIPNAEAYSFHKSWATEGFGGGRYLIDQDGLVVDVFFNESATKQFIAALMQRQRAGGDRAEK